MTTDSSELSRVDYWDKRYQTEREDPSIYEWFRTFENLRPFFEASLPPKSDGPRILHLGCGLSSLPEDLYNLGYENQCSVDFSPVAIDFMKEKHKDIKTLEWRAMDVRKIEFEEETFDCAIDKGTLDAMLYGSLWDPEPEVKENVKLYVDEVARILKPGGKWLYITYRQPHFMKSLLARPDVWNLDVSTLQDGPGSFEYFAWVMVKAAG